MGLALKRKGELLRVQNRGINCPIKYLVTQVKVVLGTFSQENSIQWRIQDFSQSGAPTPKGLLFFNFVPENCMKK